MSEAARAERPLAKQVAQPAGVPPDASGPNASSPDASRPDASSPDAANRVAELQVSAHLMTLETGLFCVFQTQGSPQSDPATGLPGVRITPAPGLAGRPEAVSVSTFREDGWLNGTAALVRVTDGSAQILVTIYQHKGKDAAPRLQVLRLSGEPNAAAAPDPALVANGKAANGCAPIGQAATGHAPIGHAPIGHAPSGHAPSGHTPAGDAAAAEAAPPVANPAVMAHVQRMGDVGCALGEWLGKKGSRQWVEGFGLAPLDGIAPEDLEYQAVLGRNWLSPWVEAGKFCGSRGMALPLLGLKVRLKGAAAKTLECTYSATFVDGTEVGPVSGGETCEAESLAALESFQVVIHPRSGKVAAKPGPAAKVPAGDKHTVAKPVAAKPVGAAKPVAAKPVGAAKPAGEKTAAAKTTNVAARTRAGA